MAGALGLVLTGNTVTMEGSHAIPVYVDNSLPIVGPSRACVVITNEVPLAGGPPLAVRLAPAGTPAIGPAIPVYVISGSLSASGGSFEAMLDSFSDARSAGTVIGSTAPSGVLRGGADTESKLSIDHDKLRIAPMTVAGWNREGVSYPSYTRVNGLTLIVRIIDGDVQTNDGTAQHLAVGWFTSANPANALTNGNAIVVADNGVNGGQIQRNGSAQIGLISAYKMLEQYIIIVARVTGVAYYLASVAGATEQPDFPLMRPIGIDTTVTTTPIFPGVWQRALTAGAANNTRVHALDVVQVAAWANWYGTAHAADTLITGTGTIVGRTADGIGGGWTVLAGGFTITTGSGMTGTIAGANLAQLSPGVTSGLIKSTFVTGGTVAEYGIAFRIVDASNYWLFFSNGTAITLRRVIAGAEVSIQSTGAAHFNANSTHVLQVIDDGTRIRTYLDQAEWPSVGGTSDTTHAAGTGVGYRQWQNTASNYAKDFEAHPRTITIPSPLSLVGAPYETLGATTVATETFAGGAADLVGLTTTTGGLTWARTFGTKTVSRDGAGNGSVGAAGTSSGYTVPWSSTAFADLSLDVTPPGASYGSGNNSHTGVLMYQDANTWLATYPRVNDDQPTAAEIEVAYTVGGVTTVVKRVNFGTVINHGVTTTIRMTCDGDNVIIYRGTEAAICFAITDLSASYTALTINRVGTYQTAQDTGSTLDNFVAKSA